MLTLTIDRDDGVPVYEQVAAQVRRLIATGELPVGAALPPVRRLAGDLGVGLNTVARAYRLLGSEGFLVSRDRSRVQVAAPARRVDREGRAEVLQSLRADLARLSQLGLGRAELRRLVGDEIEALDDRLEDR